MENKMQVTTNVEQLKSTVENSFPSVWSKDDVMRLLEQVQVSAPEMPTNEYLMSGMPTLEDFNEMMSEIDTAFDKLKDDIDEITVEEDDIELSISYGREISIDNIEIRNLDDAKDAVDNLREKIMRFMEQYKPTAENTEETEA